MGNWFSRGENLSEAESEIVIKNENLIELRKLYRDSRLIQFTEREECSNRYLNELIRVKWLQQCRIAAENAYMGVYFKNRLISSDIERFRRFIIDILGENIKIRVCCNISIIWGTNDDELCEINFGHGAGKYAALKQLNIREPIGIGIGVNTYNGNEFEDVQFENSGGIVI